MFKKSNQINNQNPFNTMTWFGRLKTAKDIPPSYYTKEKELKGISVSIGDGDGLRFYQIPLCGSLCSAPTPPRRDGTIEGKI